MTRRWFLPETPDVLGMLREQLTTTHDALVAFAAWAHGEGGRADEVRTLEHRADEQKRILWRALRTAFVTPVDAEDLYVLSAGLDEVLNDAKDTVREADVMSMPPDAAIAQMCDLLVDGARHLGEAFAALGDAGEAATVGADAAVKSQRSVERVYRRAMSELLEVDDLREVMGRRELYGRVVAISERMRAVAERVWYAVVKEA
ncbi:MAG: hypothetical protein AMXMBFR46_05130 [Acidimicrobiia bacterium]